VTIALLAVCASACGPRYREHYARCRASSIVGAASAAPTRVVLAPHVTAKPLERCDDDLPSGPAFVRLRYRFRVEQPTRGEMFLWRSDAPISACQLRIAEERTFGEGEDLLLVLSVTGDAMPEVDAALLAGLGPFRAVVNAIPDQGPGESVLGSDPDATALAVHTKEILRAQRSQHRTRRTHLILYAPSGFALFLGQRLNAVGEIVAYERTADGGYQAAVTLQSG
jgi:hypothetical protein